MPLARTYSVALVGVTGHVVEVEADIANGLVGMILVGLPDTALREARDRIRAAIVFPLRSTCRTEEYRSGTPRLEVLPGCQAAFVVPALVP